MEKETFKEYILMCFMTYGTIITEVFYTLRKDRKYVSKVLCSLEKEGLISENKIAVTDRHKKANVHDFISLDRSTDFLILGNYRVSDQ